jgi:hypothetical protein
MVIRVARFLLGLATVVVTGYIGASCASEGLWFPVWNLYVAAVVVSSSLMASTFELPLTLVCSAVLSVTAVVLALFLGSLVAVTYAAGLMTMSVTVLVTVVPGKEAQPDLRRYKE